MQNSIKLRELIAAEELLMVPGAFDGITANIIKKSGFKAAYVTGAGVSMSVVGQPDLNTVSYAEAKERVANICSVLTDIPVIVDVDTGYGGPLNILRMIKDFEQIGVAGIQIEDQLAPKRCGHVLGRNVVSCEEMCQRIRVIVENRSSKDGLVIIARTDARTEHGIDEAITRGNRFLENGADVAFIESPETMEEIRRIGKEVKGPTLFNNIEGGRSPFVGKEELEKAGFSLSIYPNTLARIMIKSGLKLLEELKRTGTTEKYWPEMMKHKEMFGLFDFDEWISWESQYRYKNEP